MYVDVARVGGALRFGETQALAATLPPSHDLAAGTISFWFQPEFDSATTTAVHDLFIVGPNTYSPGRVRIFNNREYADLRVNHDGASGGDLLSGVRLAPAQWVLVTYTWDSASGTRRLQLNGDVAAESNAAAWTLPAGGAPRDVYIGRTANYQQGARGVIDEVSIWSTFSSVVEVAARLEATPPLVDVDPPGAPASLSVFELGFSVLSAAGSPGSGESTYAARVNLFWAPSVDNVAVSGYLVYRSDGQTDGLIGNVTHASFRDALTYTLPAGRAAVSVAYRVVAYDAARWLSANVTRAIVLSPASHVAASPEPLEEDQYGGATNLRLANREDPQGDPPGVLHGDATGYFHVARLGTTRWWIVSPLGNPLVLRSMYHASRVSIGKYANSLDWGEATVRALRGWGFNAVSEYASRYVAATNALSGDRVRIPMTPHVQPAYYAVRRQQWAVKDLVAGTRADVYTGWRHSTAPDVFDGNMEAYVDDAFQTYGIGEYEWATGGNQEYIMAMHSDDLDYLFGFGAGVDFELVIDGVDAGFAKSQPHLGFLVLITNTHQTRNEDLDIDYTDTVVHSKGALIDFLSARYVGDISALNSAWHDHANYSGFASEGGGWGVGRGLADEDGTCPSTSSAGACWLGSGSYRENSNLANVRPALLADMDAYLTHHVGHYLQSMRGVIAQHVPGRMYWGPTSLGGWGAPARGAVYRAAGQHLDTVGVGLGGATAGDFEARLAFVRTHLGADLPLVNWEGFKAQGDSSMQAYDPFAAVRPHSDRQETRGVRYQQMLQSVLLSRAPGEHVFPFVGIKWWELYDSSSEVANWGLVTRLGNAYDGVQARTGAQECTADPLVAPGWTCGGEAADYGDMLTSVQEANALSLWIAAESAEAATSPGAGYGNTPPPEVTFVDNLLEHPSFEAGTGTTTAWAPLEAGLPFVTTTEPAEVRSGAAAAKVTPDGSVSQLVQLEASAGEWPTMIRIRGCSRPLEAITGCSGGCDGFSIYVDANAADGGSIDRVAARFDPHARGYHCRQLVVADPAGIRQIRVVMTLRDVAAGAAAFDDLDATVLAPYCWGERSYCKGVRTSWMGQPTAQP